MFGVNTYVVYDPASKEAAIVDPGMIDVQEREALTSFIDREGLTVTQLIDTHTHCDHIFSNTWVRDRYGLKIKAGQADEFMAITLPGEAARFRVPVRLEGHAIDVYLHDGDTIKLGDEELKVIAVPGHSPGSMAIYAPQSGFVITGDVLFRGSIGRTDLPGGDLDTLLASIRNGLFTLPPSTVVLPGHGDETTIGDEMRSNPFFK